ncbi:hypothetical protein BDN70DRAFT_488629 [Pholiota conissans]|uniref:HBS1-like protein N-terminal domain-containing protein n=1 Tax=Pholiota conissans TaxID=109636 RepID=A0A9P5Z8A9_9AGAR|nr:hypothetical protein BDN70DRAFT_488629 [Pholiota conissans]
MSRHRDVRNLNIADELDDDALSDGGDDELTQEQQDQMNDGLEQVRRVIGNEDVSGLSDNSIKDALWEYYFDVEKTITWAFEERERREIAKERKEPVDENDWETGLNENYRGGSYQYYQTIQIESAEEDEVAQHTGPRLPSIFLAQQQPGFDNRAYLEVPGSPIQQTKRLSTISEKSEWTEPSTLWRPRQQPAVPNTPRSFVSSTTTSYGQEIEGKVIQPDPNMSRTTPSGSAIQRLSTYEPPPSNSSNGSQNDHQLVSSTEHISSLKDLPSIPDLESKSSRQAMKLYSASLPTLPNKSQSKLSKLASSRTSSVSARSETTRSESSRSSGTAVTGSIKTYPALRPSAQSERPPSSVASKDLPSIPSKGSSTTGSATSAIVRRAIEAAMELEDMDKESTSPQFRLESPAPSQGSEYSKSSPPDVRAPPQRTASSQIRPLSKLAQLAQQKAEAANRYIPSPEPSSVSTARPLSKLAILAQQKVDATRIPKLPKTTTEYLTPIANGSSVTTAITTSYQSLYSLTDPSRPNIIPKLDVVPLQAIPVVADQKTSKLAMKVKRAGAGEKVAQSPQGNLEDDLAPPVSPIFQPKSTHAHKKKGKEIKRSKKEHSRHKSGQQFENHNMSSATSDAAQLKVFAFDGPSPDDVILNARKGSSLGSKASSKVLLSVGASQPST